MYDTLKRLSMILRIERVALNLKKTNYMILSRSRNIELPTPLIVPKLAIERKREARFLGSDN